MKAALKSVFCLSLMFVAIFGLTLVTAPDAQAGAACPLCYVPAGASGWTEIGGCIGGPSHCPVYYRLYRNNYTGQECRGQFGVANI